MSFVTFINIISLLFDNAFVSACYCAYSVPANDWVAFELIFVSMDSFEKRCTSNLSVFCYTHAFLYVVAVMSWGDPVQLCWGVEVQELTCKPLVSVGFLTCLIHLFLCLVEKTHNFVSLWWSTKLGSIYLLWRWYNQYQIKKRFIKKKKR